MKHQARVTPADLVRRCHVAELQVRRVLRKLFGTLEEQHRGPRWYLTAADVTAFMQEARRRGWHCQAVQGW